MKKIMLALAGLSLLASHAFAASGDPLADGFTYGAHSYQSGSFVGGSGQFSYDLYTKSFTLGSGDALLTTVGGSTWSVGDQVIGIGGVFQNTLPTASANGWGSAYSSTTINTNITSSLRMVSKFGASPTAWTTSTSTPIPGNGNGSFSGGQGGFGSVLLANTAGDLSSTASGVLRLPSIAQLYTGSVANINAEVGRLVYVHNAGIVSSWEAYLNVTLLQSLYTGTGAMAFGNRHNVALQRGGGVTHDAVVLDPVPEPATLSLVALAALRKRKKRNA